MSERGSFTTEYIYCDKCFQAAKTVLLKRDKGLCSQVIESWSSSDKEMPIIAGKVGASYSGEEIHDFEFEYGPALAKVVCHPLRIAVLAESGQEIMTITPIDGAKK